MSVMKIIQVVAIPSMEILTFNKQLKFYCNGFKEKFSLDLETTKYAKNLNCVLLVVLCTPVLQTAFVSKPRLWLLELLLELLKSFTLNECCSHFLIAAE